MGKYEAVHGSSVGWRSGGHEPHTDSNILRFAAADLNRIITNAAVNADLYRVVQKSRGHPPNWQVLPLSCFAPYLHDRRRRR
jgi:hypothetical protein